MSKQAFPVFSGQPKLRIETAKITGASVGATQGSAGLDGRGKFFCTIALSGNTYTINYLVTYPDAPIPIITPLTANCAVDITTQSTSQLVFNSVTRDAHGTPINTANFLITWIVYDATNFVS